MTLSLRTSPALDNVLKQWAQHVSQNGRTRFTTGTNLSSAGVSSEEDGLLRAGTNMTRQFVGSFTVIVTPMRGGMIAVEATNATSLKSFLYHIPGVQNVRRGEGMPGSTMTQTYS